MVVCSGVIFILHIACATSMVRDKHETNVCQHRTVFKKKGIAFCSKIPAEREIYKYMLAESECV